MNFLLDENIPPSLAGIIEGEGFSSVHVRDLKLLASPDEIIFDYAAEKEMIIITHDLDFGRIHAYRGKNKPSVILFRIEPLTVNTMAEILLANLKVLETDLQKGAIVVIDQDQIRIRELPIKIS
ncbi:MAG: DUF5615 family PIN-like protein [Bacteroidia bacterium]